MYRNVRDGRSATKNWQARSFDRIAIYIYIILSTDSQKPEAEAGSRKPEPEGDGLEGGKPSFFKVLGGGGGGKRDG